MANGPYWADLHVAADGRRFVHPDNWNAMMDNFVNAKADRNGGGFNLTGNNLVSGNYCNSLLASTIGTANTKVDIFSGSIEITNSVNGASLIDFKNSAAEDYDCRISRFDDGLNFYAGGNTFATVRIVNGKVGVNGTPLSALHLVSGDGIIAGPPNGALTANLYYNGGWKYIGNGNAGALKWVLDTDSMVYFASASGFNSAGSGAAATFTNKIGFDIINGAIDLNGRWLWFDSSGRLRTSGVRPSNFTTDGVVVGTQS